MFEKQLYPTPEEQDTYKIAGVALAYELTLSANRLEQLTAIARSTTRYNRGFFVDPVNGLQIERPQEDSLPDDRHISRAANMQFMPSAGGHFGGTTWPSPEHATLFAHKGIEGFQNYMLLVDAGFLPQPRWLVGITNQRMARVTTRLGFDIIQPEWASGTTVVAPFKVVRERVFSEDIRHFDRLLAKRLATMAMGRKTLAAEVSWID